MSGESPEPKRGADLKHRDSVLNSASGPFVLNGPADSHVSGEIGAHEDSVGCYGNGFAFEGPVVAYSLATGSGVGDGDKLAAVVLEAGVAVILEGGADGGADFFLLAAEVPIVDGRAFPNVGVGVVEQPKENSDESVCCE